MKAKSNRFSSITAFNGLEYVRYEWRDVPGGLEDEARRNPLLELQEDAPEPEPVAVATKPSQPKRRGSK